MVILFFFRRNLCPTVCVSYQNSYLSYKFFHSPWCAPGLLPRFRQTTTRTFIQRCRFGLLTCPRSESLITFK